MDYRKNPSRYHSRKLKSASVLPVHPELCRRSGIRHFTRVPSIRLSTEQTTNPRKFSNIGKRKFKNQSVLGPMQWRKLLNSKSGVTTSAGQYTPKMGYGGMPQTMEIARGRAREERALNNLQIVGETRDPLSMMRRVPVPGEGCILVPQQQSHLDYPYPQHIPPAAAASNQIVSCSAPMITTGTEFYRRAPQEPSRLALTFEEIMFVIYGIAIAIGSLFAWIFRRELVMCGGIIAVLVVVWKLGEWNHRASLLKQEQLWIQQGREPPAQQYGQVEQYGQVQSIPPRYHRLDVIPGGWLA
jgi:hypothetical protein